HIRRKGVCLSFVPIYNLLRLGPDRGWNHPSGGVLAMRNTFLSAILLTLCAVPVVAQQSTGAPASDQPDNAALMQKIRDLEDRVIALEGQLRTIKSQQAPPPQPSTEAGAAPAVQ